MDLNTLATLLRTQAETTSTIVLDKTVFPDSTLDSIRAAFALSAGKNLTINGVKSTDIPNPVGDALTIKAGTASVLKQDNVPVGLTFTVPDGVLQAVIVTDMAGSWKFKDSFPELDTFPFKLPKTSVELIKVSSAHFAYTTFEHKTNPWPDDPSYMIPLEVGLNFWSLVTFAYFDTLKNLLGDLIGDWALKFYGALDTTAGQKLPVGTLRAPLAKAQIKVGVPPLELALDEPAVAVRIGAADDNAVQQIDLQVETLFKNPFVSSGMVISIGIPVTGGSLEISATPPKQCDSFDELIKALPGGQTFRTYIPGELSGIFKNIALNGFSMLVSREPKVTSMGLSISTREPWNVIRDVLELKELSLEIETIDPKGLNLTRAYVNATARFLPNKTIFPDPFAFKVELEENPSWQVSSVSGSYYGTVGLGEIVKELLGSDSSVPAVLRNMQFSDFAVRANKTGSDYNYRFSGSVDTSFPIFDRQLTSTLHVDVDKTTDGYQINLGGALSIGEQVFTLKLDLGKQTSKLNATWKNSGTPFGFSHIASAFAWDSMPALPEGLDLGLKDATFNYDFKDQTVALKANSVNYGHIVFASLVIKSQQSRIKGKRVYLFSIDVPLNIKFSKLPVVGEKIPEDMGVEKLQIIATSAALEKPDLAELNALIEPDDRRSFPESLTEGFTLVAMIKLGEGDVRQVVLPLKRGDKTIELEPIRRATGEPAPAVLTTPTYGGDAKWFTLNKTLGPVQLDKVGVQYQDSALRFLLNAAVSAAGLTLSVDGLSIGSPLTKFDPSPELRGLGIDYKNDAVQIGGAFLRTAPDRYDGAAVIKTKQLTLSALGSYAKVDDQPSLFIYAFMDYPLGGPAFFFVTGLAAGFGYNRRLIAPSIDKVAEFPLVKQAVGKKQDAPKDVLTALERLKNDVPPSIGDIFLAVGVKFNSFKLIDSFALLTFEFGNHFVVNLLGLSTAVVPTPETGNSVTPLAQVQIAWKASFDPDTGRLAIDAQLTPNSYILSKECRLSGGYAFYSWFSGEHAGDFVQTLGGYHPQFQNNLPAHYPKVPRLAFDWRVSSSLTIQGSAYYALTGSALMAGGYLEVLFREGGLRAWLKLEANFLIGWKPYRYDIRVSVNVGASYTFDINLLFTSVRVTISVDVGADLHLWGPDFSGTAQIDISVISFTIAFGAGASQKPDPIKDWSIFQQSFLPANNVCSISVQDGLVRKLEQDQKERWIINPKQFSLSINSAIPFKFAYVSKTDRKTELDMTGAYKDFGVRPMAKTANDVESALTITLKKGNVFVADDDFKYTVIKKLVPKGLWDPTLDPDLSNKSFLPNVASAIEIKPGKELDPGTSATINLDVFQYSETDYEQSTSKKYAYFWEEPGGFENPSSEGDAARRKRIETSVGTNPTRAALVIDLKVDVKPNIRGNIVAEDFMSAPQIGDL